MKKIFLAIGSVLLVLMGHMDVVPVEPGTESAWEQSPYAGYVDDEYIWGRGTLDNKNERILKEDYGNSIRFYRQIILNATQ
ncbi:MAG: M20/M25/M40 family metallo-hydrolase [Rhodothermaceae bacterium]|nr:M20/M25/M40 family metallo-hydrolase [Rhodothermaceae bacterium]